MGYETFLEVAKEAALLGGEVLRDHFGRLDRRSVDEKAKNDFVTAVDLASEERIKEHIKRHFPDHSFLAEESGEETHASPYRWVIDPLDGTTNYIQGFPVFCVSIALLEEGEVVLGVIYDPNLNDLYWAVKGGGAYKDGEPIHVTDRESLEGAFLATGFPFRAKDVLDPYLETFKEVFLKAKGVRRAGSAALDLAYVARGVFDGFFEFGLSSWDLAAGSILIREAGGVITDFGGGNRFLESGNAVAGTPGVHSHLLSIVRKHFKLEM